MSNDKNINKTAHKQLRSKFDVWLDFNLTTAPVVKDFVFNLNR